MADPIWMLGPSGDLRPLICPERDVDITPVRYGGIRQGLSGARNLDVTGHRMEYGFKWTYLDQLEYQWIEAMHLRHLKGPFRMLDPLKKNRLTPESSSGKLGKGTAQGAEMINGIGSRVYDWPAGIFPGNQSTAWTNRSASVGIIRFDKVKRTTVIPGETLTASVWLKSTVAQSIQLVLDWWDRTTQTTSSTTELAAVTTAWTRFSITRTVPAGTHSAVFAFYFSNATPIVNFAAAQIEQGSVATDWELGGGAPIVLMDQLTAASPRFPYRDVEMNLLEA